MRIESGTTGERRTRLLLFLAMCAAFAGWFAYDGYIGYPAKNLEWARGNIPDAPKSLRTNPLAIMERLRRVQEGMSLPELRQLLGEAACVQGKRHTHMGAEVAAVVEYDDQDQVVRVLTTRHDKPPENANPLVTPDRVSRVTPGMSPSQVRVELGSPVRTQEQTLWYVGPAAIGGFEFKRDAVSRIVEVRENSQKTERDIFYQKVIAALLAVVVVFTAWKCWQVIRTRVLLDDEGLEYNGLRVNWDAMRGLVCDEYLDKGWVDLRHETGGKSDTLRLDCYHIDRFRDIVTAICERKGFDPPFRKSQAAEPQS